MWSCPRSLPEPTRVPRRSWHHGTMAQPFHIAVLRWIGQTLRARRAMKLRFAKIQAKEKLSCQAAPCQSVNTRQQRRSSPARPLRGMCARAMKPDAASGVNGGSLPSRRMQSEITKTADCVLSQPAVCSSRKHGEAQLRFFTAQMWCDVGYNLAR